MGAAERGGLATLAAGLLFACASGDQGFDTTRPTRAKAEIEQTKQAAEAEPGGEAAAPRPPVEPEAAPEPAIDATETVTTKPGVVHFKTAPVDGPPPEQPSLFEAAEAEGRRRNDAAPARLIITDANLGDYSESGRLTELTTERVAGEDAATPESGNDEVEDETYWRTRVRDARLAWRAAADRIEELEAQVAKLRFEFYAQDDPHHRDGVTKPAWDRAAIDLEQARFRVEEIRLQVDRVLEEGYRAGALPGWLREGLEFEPQTDPPDRPGRDDDLETAEAIEPPIAEEPPR